MQTIAVSLLFHKHKHEPVSNHLPRPRSPLPIADLTPSQQHTHTHTGTHTRDSYRHTFTHIHTRVHSHTYTHIYTHTHVTHTDTHIHTHTHIYTHTHVTHTYTHTFTHIHTYVCIHTHTHICLMLQTHSAISTSLTSNWPSYRNLKLPLQSTRVRPYSTALVPKNDTPQAHVQTGHL